MKSITLMTAIIAAWPAVGFAIDGGTASSVGQVVWLEDHLDPIGATSAGDPIPEMCSGTLVSCNQILTAKHCVDGAVAACADPDCFESNLEIHAPVALAAREVYVHPTLDLALIGLRPTDAPVDPIEIYGCPGPDTLSIYRAHGWGPTQNLPAGTPYPAPSRNRTGQVGLKFPFSEDAGNVLLLPTNVGCRGDSGGPLRVNIGSLSRPIAGVGKTAAFDPTIVGSGPCGVTGDPEPTWFDRYTRVDIDWARSVLGAQVDMSSAGGTLEDSPWGPFTCTDSTQHYGPYSRTKEGTLTLAPSDIKELLGVDCRLDHQLSITMTETLTPGADQVGAYYNRTQPLVEVRLRRADDSSVTTSYRTLNPESPSTAFPSQPIEGPATYAYTGVITEDELAFLDENRSTDITVTFRFSTDTSHGCSGGTDTTVTDHYTWTLQVDEVRITPDFDVSNTPFIAGTCANNSMCPAAANCDSWAGVAEPRAAADPTCLAPPPSPAERVMFTGGYKRRKFAGCHDLLDPSTEIDPTTGQNTYGPGGWYTPDLASMSENDIDAFVGCIADTGVQIPGGPLTKSVAFLPPPPGAGSNVHDNYNQAVQRMVDCGCTVTLDASGKRVGSCP